MTVFNKTRFLLVSTALIAALQAEGMNAPADDQPISLTSQTRAYRKNPVLNNIMQQRQDQARAMHGPLVTFAIRNAKEKEPFQALNLIFSLWEGLIDDAYQRLSSGEKELLNADDQAKADFCYPGILADCFGPAWSRLNGDQKIEIYQSNAINRNPKLNDYRRTLILATIDKHLNNSRGIDPDPKMGFEAGCGQWDRLPLERKKHLAPYVTYFDETRLVPLKPHNITDQFPRLLTFDFNRIPFFKEYIHSCHRILAYNQTLIYLNLNYNKIDDAGAKIIAKGLEANITLTNLDLSFNQIDETGGEAIAEALRTNRTLTNLRLWSNQIGDVGGRAILEALRANTKSNLKTLDLSYNGLSQGLKDEFCALAREREFEVILLGR